MDDDLTILSEEELFLLRQRVDMEVQRRMAFSVPTLDLPVYLPELPPEIAPGPIPAWVQPDVADGAFGIGVLVRHRGSVWRSEAHANMWEPGEFGWTRYA